MLAFLGMATMGFNELRLGDWTLSDLLFVLSVGATAAALYAPRRGDFPRLWARRSPPLILLGSLLLLTASTLSGLTSTDSLGTAAIVLRFAWLTFIWFWLLRALAFDPHALATLIRGFLLTALISSTVAVAGYVGVLNTVTWGEGRETGFFQHPNDFAGLLVVSIPFFLAGVPQPSGNSWMSRIAALGRWPLAGLVCFAIATTGSMSGALGAITGILAVILLVAVFGPLRVRRRPAHVSLAPVAVLGLSVIAAIAFVAFVNSGSPLLQRFDAYRSGATGVTNSVESRGERNQVIIDSFDSLLLTGTGFTQGEVDQDRLLETRLEGGVHNMYLNLLAKAGLAALVGLLLILVATVKQGMALITRLRGTEHYPTCVALLASLAGICVFATFQPTEFQRFFWLPIALMGALWTVVRTEVSARDVRSRTVVPAVPGVS